MDAATKTFGNGRYALESVLARGGMGTVWRARDTVLDREVAIKVVGDAADDSSDFSARFRDEARHAASLHHPGIAAVHDYGEDDDGAYLVMELVDGETLAERLARDRVPPLAETVRILGLTADALAAAHAKGIVHRDVKPGNIMLAHDGAVKVTDFGVSRSAASMARTAPLTRAGEVIGTPQYMSPEQATGGDIGPASDIYSLGVIAHEMLAGSRPFTGDSPAAVAYAHVHRMPPPLPESVPAPLRDVVARSLAKDPEHRPASAAAMANALRAVVPPATDSFPRTVIGPLEASTQMMPAAGVAVAAPRLDVDPVVVSGRGPRRGRRLAVAGGLLALVALIVVLATHDRRRELVTEATGTSTTGVAVTDVGAAAAAAVVVTTAAPQPVIDPAVYIGRPAAEAHAWLEPQGLVVDEQPVETADAEPGTVLDITPTGAVATGSTITLTVAQAPPAPPAGGKGKKDKGDKEGRG